MPHIPDLGLKPATPADAVKRTDLRATHPIMYGLGRRLGWVILLAAMLACAVLSIGILTALAHLYWRLTDAVWRLT